MSASHVPRIEINHFGSSHRGRTPGIRCLILAGAIAGSFSPAGLRAQAPAAVAAPSAAQASAPGQAASLEQLVGPIALYADDLVAIILPASTNPLQIVQAERFLEKRKADPKAALDDKWDESVKSLLNYPEVVRKMSADLEWTSALGEAVVSDPDAVLEAVQVFRRKTQSVGNLKSDGKQTVVIEKEVIKIVPADPQVIYVPQYNAATVVVSARYGWGYYPSPYPVYYYPYPPGAALATGLVWGAAIGAAWNGGQYVTHYGGGGNTINVNRNVNVNVGNINTANVNRTSARIQDGSTQWKPNRQPGQMSGNVARTQASTRTAGAGTAGVARAPAQASGAYGSAFAGAGSSGRQAQMDSVRGADSRRSMSGYGAGSSRRAVGGGGRGRRR